MSWGGLKGAVPLLLAGFPALEAWTERDSTAAIVLVATAASIVVQGATLSRVAARTVAHESPPGRRSPKRRRPGRASPSYTPDGAGRLVMRSIRSSSSSVPIRTGPLNHLRAERTHQPPKMRPMPANQRIV